MSDLFPRLTKKKNASFPRVYPFPIVREDSECNTSEQGWECIIGHLKELCVEVTDEENMHMLFTMGFYGKGTHSRSTPKSLEEKLKKQKTISASERKKKDKNSVENAEQEEEEIEVVDTDEENESVVKRETDDGDSYEENESIEKSKNTNESDKNKKIQNVAKRRKTDEIEVLLSDSYSTDNSNGEPPAVAPSEKEVLQLTFEEAFFLCYGLGCLVVKDKDQPLDIMKLWNKFCELHPAGNFPVMYTAYHHYRSKGWVVRSGLKYGVDYVLYKDGPPFYHSCYAVIVKPVKEQGLRDITSGSRPALSWSALAGLNRICTHVNKTVLILYVIKPNYMSDNKISTPFCVSQYKLEEVIFKRWVPSENRSED